MFAGLGARVNTEVKTISFLSRKPKFSPQEQRQCLAYWAEELKLQKLLEVEENRYIKAARASRATPASLGKWLQDAKRLSEAASELLKRHSALSVPNAASEVYCAWHDRYSSYEAWALAEYQALGRAIAGEKYNTFATADLALHKERERRKAERKGKQLLKWRQGDS